MAKCKGFKTFKERGEWVELLFMAWALRKGLMVSKPWGDSSSYDVGIEYRGRLLRIQVKSTSYRLANGYQCGFRPHTKGGKRYTRRKVDFFAAYIVQEEVWYIIPAAVVLKTKSSCLMLCPVQPMRRNVYRYERYREAWKLLRNA